MPVHLPAPATDGQCPRTGLACAILTPSSARMNHPSAPVTGHALLQSLDSSDAAWIVTDTQFCTCQVNAGFERLFGWTSAETSKPGARPRSSADLPPGPAHRSSQGPSGSPAPVAALTTSWLPSSWTPARPCLTAGRSAGLPGRDSKCIRIDATRNRHESTIGADLCALHLHMRSLRPSGTRLPGSTTEQGYRRCAN